MNVWIKVHGYCTPGGDPVWECPHCKAKHVYGVENHDKQEICENCGQRNYYPWEVKNDNNTPR